MSALCRARSPLQAAQHMIRLNMGTARGAGAASDTILRAREAGRGGEYIKEQCWAYNIFMRQPSAQDDLMRVMFSLMDGRERRCAH